MQKTRVTRHISKLFHCLLYSNLHKHRKQRVCTSKPQNVKSKTDTDTAEPDTCTAGQQTCYIPTLANTSLEERSETSNIRYPLQTRDVTPLLGNASSALFQCVYHFTKSFQNAQ